MHRSGIQIAPGNVLLAGDGRIARLNGLQIGALNCVGDTDWSGLGALGDRLAGVNAPPPCEHHGEVNGCQVGMANVTERLNGLQVAYWCNRAQEVRGVQIAPFNYCRRLRGVQIGLINISREHKYPCVPIVNARF